MSGASSNLPTRPPLVTVIVAVFNGAKTLQRCIDSFAAQTLPGKELIIIDGRSTDGTVDVLQANADKLAYWESSSDAGLYDAWNKAIPRAKGEWLYFLGADDYFWTNDALERMAPHLASAFPDYRVVYGRVAVLGPEGEPYQYLGDPWQSAKKRFRKGMSLPHQGVFHHRDLFAEHGLFDIRFKYASDYEFLVRELKSRDPLFVADVVVTGWQEGGLSTNPRLTLEFVRDYGRIHELHGFSAKAHLAWASLKAHVKRLLAVALRDKRIYTRSVDLYRLITLRPRRLRRDMLPRGDR